MHLEISTCILLVVFVDKVKATATCKVTNGDAGVCLEISKCKPLWDLYKKKHKSNEDHQYISQSYCGNPSSSIIKVCCPGRPSWDTFVAVPVKYDNSDNDLEYESQDFKHNMNSKNEAGTLSAKVNQNNPPIAESQAFCGLDYDSSQKTKGGVDIIFDQYPWLTVLEYSTGAIGCCGSLITTNYVLTAAHCLNGIKGAPTIARLAEYNFTSSPAGYVEDLEEGFLEGSIIVPVEKAFAHPSYSRTTLQHDIGLVKLGESITLSGLITTVCLPTIDYISTFTKDTYLTVAIMSNDPEYLGVKKEIVIPYVPMKKCRKIYSKANLIDNQICAGGEHGIDTCKGDSGGPLMYQSQSQYIVVGVVSYGPNQCGTQGRPAVYTGVYKYLNWITSIIQGTL